MPSTAMHFAHIAVKQRNDMYCRHFLPLGSKETAMRTTRLKRMALPAFVAGWMVFFGVAVQHAQAQFVNPVPPPPPPVFNPSSPSTVPQSRETPVSPRTPSALPGSDVPSPSGENLPGPDIHAHRRTVTSTTATPNAGKAHSGQYATRHHRRSWGRGSDGAAGTVLSASYRLPIGYDGPYCVWRPEWDGYWAPACSWR
jgi:hypothetical protein